MRILITGSNGFVGSRLMYYFEKKGFEVAGIDRNPKCNIEPHRNTIIGDILRNEDLEKLAGDFDWLIHCAAAKHDFGVTDEQYYEDNVTATESIAAFALRRNILKLVYYSTVSSYGHEAVPCDENGPFKPNTYYGETKYLGEGVLEKWLAKTHNGTLVLLRPSVIYGPHNYANMYNLINTIYKFPFMVGKGGHIKSLVSLENLADMTWFTMENAKPGISSFNTLDKPYVTLRDINTIILKNKGASKKPITIPYFLAQAPAKFFDVLGRLFKYDFPLNSDRLSKYSTSTHYYAEKIREAGYVQKHSIEDELNRMVNWYLEDKKKG
ncbi:MAG: NAD(P)-dependent oxidoreductase [Bacteroidota bacterium]